MPTEPGLPAAALPPPVTTGRVSLEEALRRRRSVRRFTREPISPADLSQLLWAMQGMSGSDKHGPVRTTPSAGRTNPLEVYVVTTDGVALYGPAEHRLQWLGSSDVRAGLAEAALDQDCVRNAPLLLAVVGVVTRAADAYHERAERFVTLEAGHATQNALLQATALGLGAVPVGSFDDDQVCHLLGLSFQATPLYLICIGHPEQK